MSQVDWKRIGRMAWVVVGTTLAAFVLLMFEDLFRFLPREVRAWWVEGLALAVLAAYGLVRRLSASGPESGQAADRVRRALALVDSPWTEWILQKGLVILVAGVSLAPRGLGTALLDLALQPR
jgi:hypothetical protein